MKMNSLIRMGLACVAALLLHGCALQAPAYSPAVENIETARKSGAKPMSVGSFTVRAGADGVTAISLRGNSMSSPVGADYAAYLAEALRQELVLAGKLDAKSTLVVSGTLLKNDIAAGGFSTNSGEIEARFIVTVAGQTRYDAVLRAEASWDSSFVGAVAIPKAQQQYPILVQQLLAKLWADSRFIAAVQ